MKTGLVLEGGALRTIFSSGVCDAFLNEKLPMPDYTIGVSAGIAYGVSYLSRQKRRNLQLLMHYANGRRYMGWGNFFDPRNRSYFGLKFAYDTIPTGWWQLRAQGVSRSGGGGGHQPADRPGRVPGGPPAGRQLPPAPGHMRHARAVPAHPAG